MRLRRHPFTLAPAQRTHRPAVLRNAPHTIRTINNDYNGRYGRPIVWKEASQRGSESARHRHWTESNEIMLLSSLFSLLSPFPSLCLSANKEQVSLSPSLWLWSGERSGKGVQIRREM